jgi:predicted ribosomally synthesized peptide with nif11-like leader
MKRHDVDSFLDAVSNQDRLRQEIDEALEGCEDRSAATVEFAQKAGFAFSVEEFEEALAKRFGGRELDDTELDAVAGGVAAFSGRRGGMSISFPDVCKTPSAPAPFVPVPYPNIGRGAGGSGKKRG